MSWSAFHLTIILVPNATAFTLCGALSGPNNIMIKDDVFDTEKKDRDHDMLY